MKISNCILTFCTLVLMASCNFFKSPQEIIHHHTSKALYIMDVKFDNENRKATLHLDATKDFNDIDITDTAQVDIELHDKYCKLLPPIIQGGQPTLESIRYIAPDIVAKHGLTTLMLIDLSQPTPVMKKQMEYAKKIQHLFAKDNLFMAFMMPDGSVSPIMKATDYVLDNYIATDSPLLRDDLHMGAAQADTLAASTDNQHAWLYRSVSHLLYYVSGHTGTIFDDARYKALVIFSDGQVYDEVSNMPLDPDHFNVQERLVNQARNLPTNTTVFYVNLSSSKVNNSVKDNNMMRMLCMQSKGKFLDDFDWIDFRDNLLQTFNITPNDYEVELRNPDGKIFLGSLRNMEISFYRKGTHELLADCNTEYRLGSIDKPIIVGDASYTPIYLTGWLIALLIITLVYIIMQLIVPYIRYLIFRNRYVVKYTGSNMSVQGRLVADTCYFCKAPFQLGDTIVAKCQHTMHEECWMENDQHCPEHGKHCPEGAHFYDSLNILNPRNGSYIIQWLIPAVLVATLAWFAMSKSDHDLSLMIIEKVCHALNYTDATTQPIGADGTTDVMKVSPPMYMLPLFGLYLAPLLTLLFSTYASYHRHWKYRLADNLLRSLVVMIFSVFVFFVEFLCVLVGDIYDGAAIFDWIPWTLVTYMILFVSTKNTRIHDLHSRTMVFVSLGMGIINAILWDNLGTYETKQQITLFVLLFILYAMVLSLVIARNLPPSEKYFLHIKGEIKEMDIALYKWLRQTPDAFVTIGRSTDCQLQINWDAQSDIAPVHAIIRKYKGIPCICSSEGNVFIGSKLLPEGKKQRLHHGVSFRIGTTVFTFTEA